MTDFSRSGRETGNHRNWGLRIRSLTSQTELRPAGVVTLVLLVMAFASVPFILSPLLPDVARTFGLTTAQASVSVSLFGATLAIAAPLIGLFGGGFPRLLLIRSGLVLFTLGLLGAALAPGFSLLLLALAITGVGASMYVPTAYALVGDHVPFLRRGRVMGRVMAGWGYAIVLCVPLGGYLADVAGWRAALLLLAGVAAIALLASGLLPSGSSSSDGGQPAPNLRSLSAAVFLQPGSRLILLVNLCNMTAFYGAYTYLGTWLRTDLSMGSGGAGFVILAYGVGLAFITLNSRLLDHIGHRRSLYLAHGGLMLGWVALALTTNGPMAMLALLWVGLFQGAALVGQSTLCSHQSDHGRGAIMAFFTCTTYLGVFAGAALFAPVFTGPGYLAVAIGAALLNGLASVLLYLGRRRLRAA